MLFLQRNNAELVGDWPDSNPSYVLSADAVKFLKLLLGEGKLPGWVKGERGNVNYSTPAEKNPEIYPISRTLIGTKNGDSSKYHYIVVKPSKDSTWKLQKAWRTDSRERVIEEFPIL